MAGHISGIDHAVKRFHVRAACGVGMTPPGTRCCRTWPGPTMCQTPPSSTFRAVGPRKKGGVAPAPDGRDGHQGAAAVPPAEAGADPSRNSGSWICCSAGGSCVAFRNLTPLLEWLKKAGGLTGCGMEGE